MRTFTRQENPRAYRTRFALAGGFSVLCWGCIQVFAPGGPLAWTPAMHRAAEATERALVRFSNECTDRKARRPEGLTPEETCLIGPEHGDLFTSLGQVEAKRTALAPDVSALLAHLLTEAGVEAGDRVAVGASGSFPGFLVGTLQAIAALDAEAVTILSLGASSYGATDPARNLLDVYNGLRGDPGLEGPPAAVSLGGAGDVGGEFDPAFRDSLLAMLEAEGLQVLYEADLARNVDARMDLYRAGGRDPMAFVNIGGAEANMGNSPAVLSLPAGLSRPVEVTDLPPRLQRGVLFQMLEAKVPVVHLLHVRGLALRFGLSWDPILLPQAGSTRLQAGRKSQGLAFWVLSVLFGAGLFLIFSRGRRGSV